MPYCQTITLRFAKQFPELMQSKEMFKFPQAKRGELVEYWGIQYNCLVGKGYIFEIGPLKSHALKYSYDKGLSRATEVFKLHCK